MQIKKKEERFSKKIFTDEYSSFISNPEYVAKHMTESISKLGDFKTGVELCCCIGSNVIQLAKKFNFIIGVDLDRNRIEMAQKNAELYTVADKTKFIVADVLDETFLQSIKVDFAVLDPEWSTRKMDRSSHVSDINLTTPSLKKMFKLTKQYITNNIVCRVPKTFTFDTFTELGNCRLENIIINNDLVFKIAYCFQWMEKNIEEDIRFE